MPFKSIPTPPLQFSVQFYEYNSRKPIYIQVPLKAGDVIKAVEFNQDTQIYDVLVER